MQRRHFLAALPAPALSTSALTRTLAGALAGTATLGAPALHAQSRPNAIPLKFTLDFRVTSQTSPFFLALNRGYYRDAGLDVSIDVGAGSVASITRVASGAYDLGLGDISALIEFQSQESAGASVQAVFQYYNRAPFVIIGRRDKGVSDDFASLKGKRVAAAAVESTRRCWPMVARKRQFGPDFFEWVTTDFSARDNVVVRGDVDAATYFHDSAVSLFARIPQQELAVLAYAQAGVHLYGNAILASQRLLAEQPEAVRAFLAATRRAMTETLADPEPALHAIKAREGILNLDVERQRWAITRDYLLTAESRQIGLGHVRPEVLATQIDEVASVFGLARKPSVEQLFNPQWLPAKT
ncbi:MAG: ABC transporter substrate-binding protein [Comamonas sp.]